MACFLKSLNFKEVDAGRYLWISCAFVSHMVPKLNINKHTKIRLAKIETLKKVRLVFPAAIKQSNKRGSAITNSAFFHLTR